MRLFFSASHPKAELDPRLPKGKRYRLLSCHGQYITGANQAAQNLCLSGQPFELMLDSGAFTAWSQGHEVLLEDLIRVYDSMLERFGDKAEAVWLISLDKIPGEKGRTASPEEIEEAIRISDHNYSILEKRYGARVLPVFHQNESDARLHEVAAMASYICVSPRNDLPEKARRNWSKEVHAKIPGVKTHGLAATGYNMMAEAPWWSVDSATWAILAAVGSIFRGKQLKILTISSDSGSTKERDRHFRTLPDNFKEAFVEEIESRGFTLAELEGQFYDRMIWNRVMMIEASEALPDPEVIASTVPVDIPLFGL